MKVQLRMRHLVADKSDCTQTLERSSLTELTPWVGGLGILLIWCSRWLALWGNGTTRVLSRRRIVSVCSWTYSASKDDISRVGLFTGIELAPRRYNQAIPICHACLNIHEFPIFHQSWETGVRSAKLLGGGGANFLICPVWAQQLTPPPPPVKKSIPPNWPINLVVLLYLLKD